MLSSILLTFLIPVVNSLADLADQMNIIFEHLTALDFPALALELHPTLAILGDFARAMLPVAISLLTLYFAVMSVWRTARMAIRFVFFCVKWGTLLAVVVGGLGWIAGGGAGVKQFNEALQDGRSREAGRGVRPPKQYKSYTAGRPWEPFTTRTTPEGDERPRTSGNPIEEVLGGDFGDIAKTVMNFVGGQVWDGAIKVMGEGQWLVDNLAESARHHEGRFSDGEDRRARRTERA
jgi:hypothetical protein